MNKTTNKYSELLSSNFNLDTEERTISFTSEVEGKYQAFIIYGKIFGNTEIEFGIKYEAIYCGYKTSSEIIRLDYVIGAN